MYRKILILNTTLRPNKHIPMHAHSLTHSHTVWLFIPEVWINVCLKWKYISLLKLQEILVLQYWAFYCIIIELGNPAIMGYVFSCFRKNWDTDGDMMTIMGITSFLVSVGTGKQMRSPYQQTHCSPWCSIIHELKTPEELGWLFLQQHPVQDPGLLPLVLYQILPVNQTETSEQ